MSSGLHITGSGSFGGPNGEVSPVSGGIFVSTDNSTTTPLGIGGTFTGTAEDITSFAGTTINLAGSAASTAPGTLYFEYSPDGTNWDVSVPITVDDVSLGIVPEPLRTVLPYFRVRYVNGGVAQTTMRLTVVHHYIAPETLTRFLNQSIGDTEPVKNVRSVITGAGPNNTATSAEYINQRANGLVDALSSTTPLLAGATFTSDWADVSGYVLAITLVHSDVASASGGVIFEFSNNQTDIHSSHTFTYDTIATGLSYEIKIEPAQYYRIRYTNGGTNQASFYLNTQLQIVGSSIPTLPDDTAFPDGVNRQPVQATHQPCRSWQTNGTAISGASWTQIVTTSLTRRVAISLKAWSSNTKIIWIRHTNSGSTTTGYPLDAGSSLEIMLQEGESIYAQPESGTQNVSWAETSYAE